jgi:hypothetical protein
MIASSSLVPFQGRRGEKFETGGVSEAGRTTTVLIIRILQIGG